MYGWWHVSRNCLLYLRHVASKIAALVSVHITVVIIVKGNNMNVCPSFQINANIYKGYWWNSGFIDNPASEARTPYRFAHVHQLQLRWQTIAILLVCQIFRINENTYEGHWWNSGFINNPASEVSVPYRFGHVHQLQLSWQIIVILLVCQSFRLNANTFEGHWWNSGFIDNPASEVSVPCRFGHVHQLQLR